MSGFRRFARDIYAQTLYGWGRSRLDRLPPGRLLILTLHRVLPLNLREQYPLPGLAVTPDELRWVLTCVTRYFCVDTVSGAYGKLRDGAADKPLLALSFDDGQLDNLEHAVPVLDEFGIKASFYLPTDYIGSTELLWHDAAAFAWEQITHSAAAGRSFAQEFALPQPSHGQAVLDVEQFLAALKHVDAIARAAILAALAARCDAPAPSWARLMTWEEVGQLRDAGHEIGAHGRTHQLLPHLDADAQADEIGGSRSAIADALGVTPRSFCYPNGSYSEHTLAAVAAAGYDNAVTTRWGINAVHEPSALELSRCDINAASLVDRHGFLSLPRLSLRLSGMQPGLSRFDGRLPATAQPESL